MRDRIADLRPLLALCLVAMLGAAIALLPLTWAGLLVLGGLATLATLLQPLVGLLLIVVAVPFGSLFQVRLGTANVGATEVVVGLALAAWCMRMIARRELRVSLPWLGIPLVLFVAVAFASLLAASSLEYGAKEVVKWVEVLAVYALVVNELDMRWMKVLVAALLGTASVAALLGIYQFVFGVGPDSFVLFDRFVRAYGTFEQPNPYAGYLGVTLPVAVGLVVSGVLRVGERAGWRWLLWAAGCGALMLAALVMTWSRGAWLGFAAAVIVMAAAVFMRRHKSAILGLFLLALGTYVVLSGDLNHAPRSITQRFADFVPFLGGTDVRGVEVTDANFASVERLAHWQAAWDMWTDHPWLGVGIGNYEPTYPQYALPMWPVALGHAHNYYLNIGAEAGVVGLAAYLLLWAIALAGTWRAAHRASGWAWGVALGILGVVVHLSVHNTVDNLFVHAIYLQLAILLGMVPLIERGG